MITEDGEDAAAEHSCPHCDAPVTDSSFAFCTSCGQRLTETAADEKALVPSDPQRKAVALTDPLDEEDAERSWWSRHRKLLVIGAAAVLVLGTGSYVGWQWSGFRTAHGPVEGFFAALEDRDGSAAAALLSEASILAGMTVTEEEVLSSSLWQAGALDSGYTPPELESVEVDYFLDPGEVDQRPDKSLARAVATFALGDAVYEMEFVMQRDVEGMSREWTIGAVPIGVLPVSGATGTVRAANAVVDGNPYAPPGVYRVEVEGNALFADAAGEVVIGGEDYAEGSGGGAAPAGPEPSAAASTAAPPETDDDDFNIGEGPPLDSMDWDLITTSTLEYGLRAEATAEVQAQVNAAIDACAAPHALDLETCPWTLVDLEDSVAPMIASALEGGSSWTVEAYPEIALVLNSSGQAQVQVVQAGRAVGEYLGPEDGFGVSLLWDSYAAELHPYGPVRVEGEALVWMYTP